MQIVELLKQNNVEHREYGSHHHVTNGWVNIDCPSCSPKSGRFRLGWNLKGQYFSCWSCGKQNSYLILREVTNLTSQELKGVLKDIRPQRIDKEVRKGKLVIPSGVVPMMSIHKDYLRSRGFKDIEKLTELWGVQGINHRGGQLSWRLFIPVIADSRIVSWTTRAVDKDDPRRYWSAAQSQEAVSMKIVLYGEDHCTSNSSIIVMEGPVDAWKVGPGATALLGLEYTMAQVLAISRYANRYICFDSSTEAQQVARKLVNDLSVFPGRTHNIELNAADPGAAGKKELRQLRELVTM